MPHSTKPSAARLARIAALAGVAVLAIPASAFATPPLVNHFEPAATFEVTGEVAEIVAVTPDGMTLLYTDSDEQEVGFVDITDPASPSADGELAMDGEPTSVAVTTDGRHALVTVNTSDGNYISPSGHLVAIRLSDREIVGEWDLGGQPDSIAVSPNGRYAAIAIENERDEDVNPDGADGEPEGGMPQLPAGWLTIVDLDGVVADWGLREVALTGLAGARFASDPEPEFIDIAPNDHAAVTLQENNAVAIVDLRRGRVLDSWSAGMTTHRADTQDNGSISFTDTLTARREPDAIGWTPFGGLVTANEGDYPTGTDGIPGGSRDFTVFSAGGAVRYEPGSSLEEAAADEGYYPDGRSDAKGVEPEGIEIGQFTGRTFLFVGAERGNFVAVYRLRGYDEPELVQLLETGSRPEGLVAIPSRNLFVSGNEDDGTISIFRGAGGS